jgi:predicted nucleic acid-binding protein
MQKMPERKKLVINTGPIIALVAALGDLRVLKVLYDQTVAPFEVSREILAGGVSGFAVAQFEEAQWLQRWPRPVEIVPYLLNLLDRGEASVIQLALNENINTVCIDESAGRRVARIHNLILTGSVGILLRARQEGFLSSMRQAIQNMESKGIWLSDRVIKFALRHSGEKDS